MMHQKVTRMMDFSFFLLYLKIQNLYLSIFIFSIEQQKKRIIFLKSALNNFRTEKKIIYAYDSVSILYTNAELDSEVRFFFKNFLSFKSIWICCQIQFIQLANNESFSFIAIFWNIFDILNIYLYVFNFYL